MHDIKCADQSKDLNEIMLTLDFDTIVMSYDIQFNFRKCPSLKEQRCFNLLIDHRTPTLLQMSGIICQYKYYAKAQMITYDLAVKLNVNILDHFPTYSRAIQIIQHISTLL